MRIVALLIDPVREYDDLIDSAVLRGDIELELENKDFTTTNGVTMLLSRLPLRF